MSALWWAIGLFLILEGLLPFASPRNWRRWMLELAKLSDRQLRAFGLLVMVIGWVLMTVVS